MDSQVVKWLVDILLGITFLVNFFTGILKFTLLMRILGLTFVVLPLAQISDLHDWSGLLLGCFVAVHLFLNRAWMMAMTRKVLGRAPGIPRTPP